MGKKNKQAPNCQESQKTCTCELCERDKPLTEHHLIPRAVHRKKHFVNLFGKEEMKSRKLKLCKQCHDGIHDCVPSEKTLASNYNTKETLMGHPAIAKHVAWVRKQK